MIFKSRGESKEVSGRELFLPALVAKRNRFLNTATLCGEGRNRARRDRKGENAMTGNQMFLYAGEYESVEEAKADLEELSSLGIRPRGLQERS
jgi:hypothetical protein